MDSSNIYFNLDNYKAQNLVALTGCSYFDNNFIFNELLNLSNFSTCSNLLLPNTNLYYNSIDYNIVNLPIKQNTLCMIVI